MQSRNYHFFCRILVWHEGKLFFTNRLLYIPPIYYFDIIEELLSEFLAAPYIHGDLVEFFYLMETMLLAERNLRLHFVVPGEINNSSYVRKFVLRPRLHILWLSVGNRWPSKFYWRNIPGCFEGSAGSEKWIQQEGHTKDPEDVQVQQASTKQLLIAEHLMNKSS